MRDRSIAYATSLTSAGKIAGWHIEPDGGVCFEGLPDIERLRMQVETRLFFGVEIRFAECGKAGALHGDDIRRSM